MDNKIIAILRKLFLLNLSYRLTCWERADLSALVGDVNCICVTFQCGILGKVQYMIVSFPDLCRLSYFQVVCDSS